MTFREREGGWFVSLGLPSLQLPDVSSRGAREGRQQPAGTTKGQGATEWAVLGRRAPGPPLGSPRPCTFSSNTVLQHRLPTPLHPQASLPSCPQAKSLSLPRGPEKHSLVQRWGQGRKKGGPWKAGGREKQRQWLGVTTRQGHGANSVTSPPMSLSRPPWNTGSCGRKQPDKGGAHRVAPLTWPHLPLGARVHASHACLCLHHISGNKWGVLRRLAGLCAGLRTPARETYEHLWASSSAPLPSVCPEGTPLTLSLSLGRRLTGGGPRSPTDFAQRLPGDDCTCLGPEAKPEPGTFSEGLCVVLGPRRCPGAREGEN